MLKVGHKNSSKAWRRRNIWAWGLRGKSFPLLLLPHSNSDLLGTEVPLSASLASWSDCLDRSVESRIHIPACHETHWMPLEQFLSSAKMTSDRVDLI